MADEDTGSEDVTSGATTDLEGGGNEHWSMGHADIQSNGDLAKFAKRYESETEMAKAGFESRKKMSGTFRLPDDLKELTEEQRAELLTRTRDLRDIPEKADEYEITIPDGIDRDENFENAFKEIMFKNGRSKDEVQELADFYHTAIAAGREEKDRADVLASDKAETECRMAWGTEYDTKLENIDRARLFISDKLGLSYKEGDEVRSKLDDALDAVDKNGNKMGNQVPILQMIDYIYENYIAESVPVLGSGPEGGDKSADAFAFSEMDG